MELPALISEKLEHYLEVPDDMALLMGLREDISDLSGFVVSACDDETWCDRHRVFMRKACLVLTRRFFRMRLSSRLAQQVAKAFQEHKAVMRNLIPRDLTILFKGQEYHVNSLLFAANSLFFRNLVAKECADKDRKYLKVIEPPFDREFFFSYLTFSEEDDLPDLWQKKPEELLEFMKMAVDIECKPLEKFAAETYKRYLDKWNIYLTTLQAYRCGWQYLYRVCQQYANSLETGLQFMLDEPGMAVAVTELSDKTLEPIGLLRDEITHLSCRGWLAESPKLRTIVSYCSVLRSLDVAEADTADVILDCLNEDLEELDLTLSEWLDVSSLEKVIEKAPHLNALTLAKNTQLNYRAWGVLHTLKDLRTLSLAGCYQLTDSDLKIVLQGNPRLQELNLADCSKILDDGFQSIGKSLSDLRMLDLSRTKVSESALVDIAYRCRGLQRLNLNECKTITDRGLLEAISHLPRLHELQMNRSSVSADAIRSINKNRPSLKIKIDS